MAVVLRAVVAVVVPLVLPVVVQRSACISTDNDKKAQERHGNDRRQQWHRAMQLRPRACRRRHIAYNACSGMRIALLGLCT